MRKNNFRKKWVNLTRWILLNQTNFSCKRLIYLIYLNAETIVLSFDRTSKKLRNFPKQIKIPFQLIQLLILKNKLTRIKRKHLFKRAKVYRWKQKTMSLVSWTDVWRTLTSNCQKSSSKVYWTTLSTTVLAWRDVKKKLPTFSKRQILLNAFLISFGADNSE
jgi:hypothetical protein